MCAGNHNTCRCIRQNDGSLTHTVINVDQLANQSNNQDLQSGLCSKAGPGKKGPGKKGPGRKGPVKTVRVKTVLGKNGSGKKGPS